MHFAKVQVPVSRITSPVPGLQLSGNRVYQELTDQAATCRCERPKLSPPSTINQTYPAYGSRRGQSVVSLHLCP
jgi:hypothetical protein